LAFKSTYITVKGRNGEKTRRLKVLLYQEEV